MDHSTATMATTWTFQLPPAACRYSGTSADLIKTCFDLMVSVKLFLGRFDMRTLQVWRDVM